MSTLESILLGLRTLVARAANTVRVMTNPERVLLGTILAVGLVNLAVILFGGSPQRGWIAGAMALLSWLAIRVIVDAVILRVAVTQVHAEKATGAPRIAEVTCKHGVRHRFVYSPAGWEAAGPAVESQAAVR